MDIDKIKKDWQQHCKEYGFIDDTFHYENRLLPFLGIKDTNSFIYVNGECGDFILELYSGDKEHHKLFTTFYEKLI